MLVEATGENTKIGALFVTAEHYLDDKRNKERGELSHGCCQARAG